MSAGRLLTWGFASLLIFVPLNWARLWATGGLPAGASHSQLIIGTIVCWGAGSFLAYFLVMSARGLKLRAAARAMQEMLAQPLTEIRPSQALMLPGEKAYGAVMADLHETETTGYSSSTTGFGRHIFTDDITLQASGTRGKFVKDVIKVASGELVITDRRVLFAGDKKSFAIMLDDLLNRTSYADGFSFHDNESAYTLITDNDRERVKFQVAMEKLFRGRLETAA
jgi:hypothetical protein